jgi:hypothetical protein
VRSREQPGLAAQPGPEPEQPREADDTEAKARLADAQGVQADYGEETVEDLRQQLRDRGLKVSGTKQELVARLEADDTEAKAQVSKPSQPSETQLGPDDYVRIPLLVELYEHWYEKDPGRRLLLSQDTPDLGLFEFNGIVTSLKVRPGPDFDPSARNEVSFCRDRDYKSSRLVLGPGGHADIQMPPHSFGDTMRSVKFEGVPAAPPVSSIPVVAELYAGPNFTGRKLIIFEDVADLGRYSGFDNRTRSARIFRGPNYRPGGKVTLYDRAQFDGPSLHLEPGEYADLPPADNASFTVSSAQLIAGPGDAVAGQAAPGPDDYVRIPLLVELYEHWYEKDPGRRLLLSQDTPDLGLFEFNGIVTSLKVRPGPDFDPSARNEVSFCRDRDYKSSRLVLGPGGHADIQMPPHSFGDTMRSVKFEGVPAAPPVSSIPVVAELYAGPNFTGRKLIIFEDVADLGRYSGFDNRTRSARIFRGPNYRPGGKVTLYDRAQFDGPSLHLEPGEYADLPPADNASFTVSSAQLIAGPGTVPR